MSAFFGSAAEIVQAAGGGTLAFFATGILILGYVAIELFKEGPGSVRLAIFLSILAFICVAPFVVRMIDGPPRIETAATAGPSSPAKADEKPTAFAEAAQESLTRQQQSSGEKHKDRREEQLAHIEPAAQGETEDAAPPPEAQEEAGETEAAQSEETQSEAAVQQFNEPVSPEEPQQQAADLSTKQTTDFFPHMVFFPKYDGELPEEAWGNLRKIWKDIFKICVSNQPLKVRLDGHADQAEADKEDLMELSSRRVKAVAEILHGFANQYNKNGCPITFRGFAYGAQRPLVEHEDGTSEPQNRKVDIYLEQDQP